MSRMAVPHRIRLARANPYAPHANFGLFSRSNRVYCMAKRGFTNLIEVRIPPAKF